jgi:Rrf2 family protein
MLRLSKKADYALLALQHLASDGTPGTTSARAIAERFDIPLELLAKILQQLAHQGLVAAHKGVHGGYHLTRPPEAISVADVIHAIDGPVTFTACSPKDTRCDQFAACTVRDPLWRIRERIFSVLQAVSVADLIGSETHDRAMVTLRKESSARSSAVPTHD